MIYLGNSPVGVAAAMPEYFVCDSGASAVTNGSLVNAYLEEKISGWATDKIVICLVSDSNARAQTLFALYSEPIEGMGIGQMARYTDNSLTGLAYVSRTGTYSVNMHEGAVYAVMRF